MNSSTELPVINIPISASGARQQSPGGWQMALSVLLLVWVVVLLLYRDTAIAMVTIWYRSETFTHAFLVPPISFWLIWRRRSELALLDPKPALWMLIPIAGMAFIWLLGDLVAVNSVTQLAFTAILVLSVPAVLGLQVARAITFPLLFLFFAVPIGEFLMPRLMEGTADFTVLALRWSGIPVYRQGLQFVIPSGNWSVVEACSGVRYLIASLTVGTLFAYLNYQSTKKRVLFILVSLLVPIVANWLRAYMIVMLGHYSGNTLAVGVDHLIYGWVFFGIVIMLMFFIGAKWSEPEPEPVARTVVSRAMRQAPIRTAPVFGIAAGLLVLAALPFAVKWTMDHGAAAGMPVALTAPATLNTGWQATPGISMGLKPEYKHPSAEINTVYAKADQSVGLYIAYYRAQDYERKLVSSDNVLVPSKSVDWNPIRSGSRLVDFGDGPITVRTADLLKLRAATPLQGDALKVWQIYWINGTLTANDYMAKAYSAMQRLLGRGDESAVIILYAVKGAAEREDAVLQGFVRDNHSAIDALLNRARAAGQ